MSEELVIDGSNFDQYFFDVRRYQPKRGQVMARFTAVVELVDGELKNDLIYLLTMTGKARECVTLMTKMGCASEKDAIRICREIAEDLQAGMSGREILDKKYEYVLNSYYYTDKENVPTDDSHWSFVEIANLDEYIEHVEKTKEGTIKSRMVLPNEEEPENDQSL